MAHIGLVHGLGGTAATMAPLAALLESAGHRTTSVTLPGHGTDPADLNGVTWSDWLDAVPDCEVLVGQSMGGALVLAAAASRSAVRAVVSINTPAGEPDALDGLLWRQSRGHEWIDGPPLADGEPGYTRYPIRALIAMVEGILVTDLSRVAAPVLLVNSADDDVVDPASADVIATSLSTRVSKLVLDRGGHVATMGRQLPELAAAIGEFCGG